MKIRKANIQDLERIIEINKFVDYENPDDFMKDSIGKGRVTVLENDGIIQGFLLYQSLWGNTYLLALVKIHPDYQKMGFGSALINNFEETIKEEGKTTYLSSTMLENKGSQIFHEKNGFEQSGILKMPYGEEIFYIKNI